MDLQEKGGWTNNTHVKFIRQMEAAFVQTMLATKTSYAAAAANGPSHLLLGLDRYVPDCSESTHGDLKRPRYSIATTTHVCFQEGMGTNSPNAVKMDKKKKRKRYQPLPSNASSDQVVPEIGDNKSDKDDDDVKQQV